MLLPFYLCIAAIFAATATYLLWRFLAGIFDCLGDKTTQAPLIGDGGCPCCSFSALPATTAAAAQRVHLSDRADYTPISGSFR